MVVRLFVGAYGPPEGTAAGISIVEHDPDRASLTPLGTVAETPSPSFLTLSPDGRTLYAVNELDHGAVSAFRLDGTVLAPLGRATTGGAHPCHLVVHPSGRYLLTANYTSGSVAVHRLGADGAIGALTDLVELTGSGPHPRRQDRAHAHMVTPGADGREVAVADLGSDRVWRLALDAETGRLSALGPPLVAPPGSGPRQVVFSPDGRTAYVLGELDGSITAGAWPPPGTTASLRAAAGPLPPGSLAAALVAAPDGRRLYASHRGADRITVLDVHGTVGTVGTVVRPVADLPAHGRWPRHLALGPHGHLYVANQRSDTVCAVALDEPAAAAVAPSPSPSCILVTDHP
ncbi:lactonase family protein [Pseudonocardia acaciae]|uniref:lactonase family protein n=1 Tax=Pseudonocardia acaciae TaxID=551276 RepID=UPI00048D588D|nr:lactonase family protein [Pseudonocardia acaciae]